MLREPVMFLKQPDTSGKEHFAAIYRNQMHWEHEWLRRGAAHKTDSIEQLLKRNSITPESVLELGCGTGAVIAECRRRNIGQRHIGIDYSEEAIEYVRRQNTAIEAIIHDITAPDFSLPAPVDLVLLSHVVEHLEDPEGFLASVLRNISFSYLLIEVPLEDLLGSRAKALFRDRRLNSAGHVQFFTPSSFRHLVTSHDLSIIDERLYAPVLDADTVRFICERHKLSPRRRLVQMATGRYLPRLLAPLWMRLYYGHFAVLCRKTT